jgi:2-hydroxychromene-2-carboxylate isomerase
VADVQPVFCYDLGSPESYLVAERVMAVLPVVPEWTPVWAAGLPRAAALSGADPAGRDALPLGDREAEPAVHRPAPEQKAPPRAAAHTARRAAVEREAASLHVQPLRWPPGWPGDTRAAMIAATYAKQIGRAVAFSLAAFRQAFAGGRDLADEDTILIAAAACEMHPRAVRQALARPSVAAALDAATAEAAGAGVRDVPAIRIGAEVFHGSEGLDQAAAALAAALAAP